MLCIMSCTSFRVILHSIVCLNIKGLLTQSTHNIWSFRDKNEIRTHNHLDRKRTLNHLTKLSKWLSCVVSIYLYVAFDCMLLSCHLRISEEFTLYSCLNVKELLAQNRRSVWGLSDSGGIRTCNDLDRKQTLNHLAILAKWFSVSWILICRVHLTLCYYHVTYAF